MDFRIIICLCLALFTGILGKTSRVYGGVPVTITDYPHLVSLRTYHTNQLLCGGSIITKWNILTAAHCLTVVLHFIGGVKVYAGTSSTNIPFGYSYLIENVYFHPDCNIMNRRTSFLHDIAVVKLRTHIEFNAFQNKIALPTRPPNSNDVAIIAGWGRTDHTEGANFSPILARSATVILNSVDCTPRVPIAVANSQFCTYVAGGTGITSGDDGGAVISNGELYGVISFSYETENTPDVHTQVYYYLNFIRSRMIE